MKKNNLVKLLGIALVVAIVSTGIFYGLFVNKLSEQHRERQDAGGGRQAAEGRHGAAGRRLKNRCLAGG